VGQALRRPAGLLALVLLVGACAAPDLAEPGPGGSSAPAVGTQAPERTPTTIRVALGRDPISIDPRHVTDDAGELVVRALFDGLVDLAPDGRIVPASAERFDVEDDGLTYRFHLDDTRFHDGEQVTAQHHADALLAVFDPTRAPRLRDDLLGSLRGAGARMPEPRPDLGNTADTTGEGRVEALRGLPEDVLGAGGIEVLGPLELVLRLERPDPLLLHELTDPALVPLPSVARDDPSGFALEPIGNGPFRMVGPREPGAFIRMAANHEHRQPPRIDGLVLQVYGADADRTQRWVDLLAGRLQITEIPPDVRAEARERFGRPIIERWGSGLHEHTDASLYAYAFTIDVPPFDDVRLRQAISAAIDREALAVELVGAGVEPADAVLPPVLGGIAAACAHCVFDPFLARALFEDWAVSRPADELPLAISLTYPRGAGHATIAERIAQDIERVLAVTVRLQSRDLGGLVRAVTAGEAPLFRLGLRASLGGTAASVAMLDPTFRPGAAENWVRWDGPATSDLLDELGVTRDPRLARELEAELLEEAAVVPLLWTRQDLVVHPDITGFRLDVTGRWWPELISLR